MRLFATRARWRLGVKSRVFVILDFAMVSLALLHCSITVVGLVVNEFVIVNLLQRVSKYSRASSQAST